MILGPHSKGGLSTRLSFFPRPDWKTSIATLGFALASTLLPITSSASENPMEAALGSDYSKQVWLASEPSRPSPDAIAGPRSDSDREDTAGYFGQPRFFSAGKFDYADLIHRRGDFAFDHGERLSSLRLGTRILSVLDVRMSVERARRQLDIGDSGAFLGQAGSGWDWTGSAAYLLTPMLVPYVAVGGDSHGERENALALLGLRGNYSGGFAWSLNIGNRNRGYPLTLDLRNYKPMSLPLQLRQKVLAAALGFRRSHWDVTWSGERVGSSDPGLQSGIYALSDSGSFWKQAAGLTYARAGEGRRLRVSADIEYSAGTHAFLGTSSKEQGLYRFAYEEAEQRSYAARADIRCGQGPWEAAVYAGGAGVAWRALRPEAAYGRHFWDRNGVLDSYQGSLLGLFDRETWLFNGFMTLEQWGTGTWGARTWDGWRGQLGLAYQHLIFTTETHLTKRTTSLLLAYTETDADHVYPTVRADVLTPELRLRKDWGRYYLAAAASQAVPVRVTMEKQGAAGMPHAQTNSPDFSGGTRATMEIGFRAF